METQWRLLKESHVQNRRLNINITVGSIPKEEVYNAFYNTSTRRLIQITPDGMDYFMSLVEDIDIRKDLLFRSGILGNPYNLTDI